MRKQNHFYLYCGILMLLSELWKQWRLTYILNHRQYNWWYFPFQLCSIPMYLCLVIPWVHYDAINMFYIRPHYYMNQIVFRDIVRLWGNEAGILSYIAATVFGGWLFHQSWKTAVKNRRNCS